MSGVLYNLSYELFIESYFIFINLAEFYQKLATRKNARLEWTAMNFPNRFFFLVFFCFLLFFFHLNQCLKDGFYFTKSQNKQDKAFFIFQYEMYACTLYIDLLFLDLHEYTLTRNENLWKAKLNLILVSF